MNVRKRKEDIIRILFDQAYNVTFFLISFLVKE